jgi:hypothetical protein
LTANPTAMCLPGGLCLPGLPDVGGDITKAAASAVLDGVASAVSDAAAWLAGHVLVLVSQTTSPDFGVDWFRREAAAMGTVVVLVVLPILMVATLGAVLRQDIRRLGRIWGVGLPLAVLAGAAAPQLAGLGLSATDELCTAVAGYDFQELAKQFGAVMAGTITNSDPIFVQMLLAGLTIVGTVLVWLELTVRSAAVYVAVFFMPLALAGYVWPATVHVAKRTVEILVALILSKFVIVASLTLGLAALQGGGVDEVMSGAAILLMAGFAPFALLRLVPVVEAAALAHLEGMSRRPFRVAAGAASTAAGAAGHPVAQLLMARAGAGSSEVPTSPAAVRAQPIPERAADYPLRADSPATGGAGHG